MTKETLFPNTDTVHFSSEFKRIREVRSKKAAKHREKVRNSNEKAFGYIERSIVGVKSIVTNGNDARLADN